MQLLRQLQDPGTRIDSIEFVLATDYPFSPTKLTQWCLQNDYLIYSIALQWG